MLCLMSQRALIQIPVTTGQRVGQSMVCRQPRVAAMLGLRMVGLITRVRLGSWFRPSSFRAGSSPFRQIRP